MTLTAAQDLWEQVKEDLRSSFPQDLFLMWFDKLVLHEQTDDSVTLAAPNEMVELWVSENYLASIIEKFRSRSGQAIKVTVRHIDGACPASAASRPAPAAVEAAPARAVRRARTDSSSVFAGTLNPKNTFETFIVGSNNDMAHGAALSVARSPASAYNPLLIYGDTGLGKTHLMHAIGHYIVNNRPDARVAYLTSEKFTNDFIMALTEASLPKFRQRYRSVDLLLIDDIQFFSGKERVQEEFFHTFNDLTESGKQIVLTSDRPVNEIENLEKRLVTRFSWGMTTDVKSPDLETRIAILRRKASFQSFSLPDDIIELIASKVTSNIRQLEGALIKVGSYSKIVGRKVDRHTAEELLKDIIQEQDIRMVTIEMVQKRVADHFGLRVADLIGRRRTANIVLPRQIAMVLAKRIVKRSLQEVGDAFGGRDHGTVIHAHKAVENACHQDPSLRATIDFLEKKAREP
jgi:chromosomal replication initiator protein